LQQQQQLAAEADDQGTVSGLQQLADSLTSEGVVENVTAVALWRCAAGDEPARFTGTEEQVKR
jgi:hypothetical protein